MTPLLRTTREPCEAAQLFYRVRLPLDRERYDKQPCLYLNPELDFIHVFIEARWHPEILANSVHDLKAYDPQGIGVLNLGIGPSRPLEIQLPFGEFM